MQRGPAENAAAYYSGLFGSHLMGVGIWPYAAIFLGMGGILRERAIGTSTLTLTLPVSRGHVMAVRVCVAVLQGIALAALPWLGNLLISKLLHRPFSFSLAFSCILLVTSGGLVYLAVAILVSSVVEGEYTSIALVFGIVILAGFLSKNADGMGALDLQRFMSGQLHIDKTTSLFLGPLPWLGMLAHVSVAAALVLMSIGIIQRRGF
jgi:ABC-2 type transport system permease protein